MGFFEKTPKKESAVEKAEKTSAETTKESLMEVGRNRREAIVAGAKSRWEQLKDKLSGGVVALKEKGFNLVDKALASPEAVAAGASYAGNKAAEGVAYVENKVAEGANYVSEKAIAAGEYVEGKIDQGSQYVGEKAKQGVEAVRGGAEYLSTKTMEGYESIKSRGLMAYENLQSKVSSAKNRFDQWRNQRRMEAMMKQSQKKAEEIARLEAKLAELRGSFLGAGI